MKTRLIKDLGNMNPGELEPKAWNGGDTSFTNDIVNALPEKECMKARIAVFEAIVDEVVEDTIDEKEVESDAPVTENEIEEVVEPIVDKAVALGIVPSSVQRKVSNLVHAKLISRKTRASLLAKAAHMVAEAVTETDYNAGADNIDTPIDETVNINNVIKDATSEQDDAPNDGKSPTTSAWLKAWDNNRSRRSRFSADDEYTAGADNIDNPINETVNIEGQIKDATSEQDDAPNDGKSPTTSAWLKAWDNNRSRRSRFSADDEYTAGADNIDNPINETVNIEGQIKDATSEQDDAPNDGKSPTTSAWLKAWDNNRSRRSRFEGDVGTDDNGVVDDIDTAVGAPEGGPANDISVDVDDGLDTETKANMRYLVKSAIHHRRATAKVSRRLSAQLTDNMMHQLRYALPAKFYNKYRG